MPGKVAVRKARKPRRSEGSADDDDASSTKEVSISFEVYQSEGMTFQNAAAYRKAIQSYNMALDLKPTHKACLIARSQCYLLLGDYRRALADADKTLADGQNNIKGILQKADVYYQMGQFEYALMFYHRGNKLRSEVQAFRLGIQKSQEAIENCIGENAGIKLTKKGDLSCFYQTSTESQVETQPTSQSSTSARAAAIQRKKRQEAKVKDSKTVKQLLGELYADKEFLDKLLKDFDQSSSKSKSNASLRDLAEDEINYLDSRTEFWQQQQPVYARKHERKQRQEEAVKLGTQGKQKTKANRMNENTQWVIDNLQKIDTAQENAEYVASLQRCERVLTKLSSWTEADVRDRQELLSTLHSYMGVAYYEQGDYERALQHHQNDYDIAIRLKLKDAKCRSLDHLACTYVKAKQYDTAISMFQKKLPLSTSALERSWLHHEIGRCHLEKDRALEAKQQGEKARAAAEEANDKVWQLNTCVLIAQAEVKLEDRETALETFQRALDIAKSIDDQEAVDAITKIIDDVNKRLAMTGDEGGDEDVSEGDPSRQEQKTTATDDKTTKQDGNTGTVPTSRAADKTDSITYVVAVETADELNADTDANAFLEIFGESAVTRRLELEQSSENSNKFQRGQTDTFRLSAVNVGKIQKIRLSHDGTKAGSGWLVTNVTVTVDGSSTKFSCNRWLDKEKEERITEIELVPSTVQ